MQRRKPKSARKEDQIRIRVTVEQKRLLVDAAESVGLDVSSWLRNLGVVEAARVLGRTAPVSTKP